MRAPVLAYVEEHLPGARPERLALAARLGLALEVADRAGAELEPLCAAGLELVTLQAFEMHALHPLQRDAERRRRAPAYARGALERAARLEIPRLLTACGFGQELADRPFERCLEFYAALEAPARDAGVRVLIEPLSPLRAAAMTDPDEVARLLAELGAPEVFSAALDAGHLVDGGRAPEAAIAEFPGAVVELQLRGPGSTPPAPDVPLARWLAAARGACEVVAVEHRAPSTPAAVERLVAHLRRELAA